VDSGSAPVSNPFWGVGNSMHSEAGDNLKKVFALGIRNSFGMAFDPVSGDLWEQENGDDTFDEINRVERGMNGGWVQLAGPIDRSVTGLPWFGRLANDRIHYAIGYSGHGVAASAIAGRALSARLLGRRDPWTDMADCLLHARQGRLPPEPLRYIGGHIVRAAILRKERAETAGRQPRALDVKLAQLAPATIVDATKPG